MLTPNEIIAMPVISHEWAGILNSLEILPFNVSDSKSFEPVEMRVHSYEQYDAERALTVGSIWFLGEFVGIFVLAGRGKDGGKAWVCNQDVFLKMVGFIMVAEYGNETIHDPTQPIDEYVNGYSVRS